ncbi:MAG: FAD-binding protein, partial [Chloroflexi bacterium]|nr:FAD-binding protein [Chloroflexota bacterium]
MEGLREIWETDVLVIGGGLAGMLAAIEAEGEGVSVSLFTRGKAGLSGSSVISQTMLLVFEGKESEREIFLSEIYEAGGRLNEPNLLEKLIDEGSHAVKKLQSYGVPLSAGKISPNGSRFYRIVKGRSKDLTSPLRKIVLSKDIFLMEGFDFIGFVKGADGEVGGGLFFKNGELFLVKAKATV